MSTDLSLKDLISFTELTAFTKKNRDTTHTEVPKCPIGVMQSGGALVGLGKHLIHTDSHPECKNILSAQSNKKKKAQVGLYISLVEVSALVSLVPAVATRA